MLGAFIYLFAVFLEFIFVFGFSIYTIFLIYSNLKGSPYVPTKMKEVRFILHELQAKKNAHFYDLGCGDGRVVRTAVENYGVNGIGIDVNPILVLYARFLSRLKKLQNIFFLRKNIFAVSLHDADIIYVFLMPELIKKLRSKFEAELRQKTIVVSHGFKIEGWENKLEKKILHKPFPTYFYRY